MDENLAQQRWPFRIFGTMFAIFAVIALVLSAVGLYAVTAYSVTQRTQEIGVRTALGAESTQVMWLFLRRAFFQLAIGLTLGIAGAFGVGKIFESSDFWFKSTAAIRSRFGRSQALGHRLAGRLCVAGAARDAARPGDCASSRINRNSTQFLLHSPQCLR